MSPNWGNGPKIGVFFNIKKNLISNFQWICSITEIFITCCAHAQIYYLGKICPWDIGQNALSQSDYRIFKWTISPGQIGETALLLASW